MVGHVQVVVRVVVVQHAAAGGKSRGGIRIRRGWRSREVRGRSGDVQLADPVRPQQVGEGRGRWGRGGAAAAVMVVVLVAPPPSARHHDAVEADVGLRGVVHAVGDGHQGE